MLQRLDVLLVTDVDCNRVLKLYFFSSRELQSTFAQLCHQVDVAKSELAEELKGLQSKISKLDEVSNKANFLK